MVVCVWVQYKVLCASMRLCVSEVVYEVVCACMRLCELVWGCVSVYAVVCACMMVVYVVMRVCKRTWGCALGPFKNATILRK